MSLIEIYTNIKQYGMATIILVLAFLLLFKSCQVSKLNKELANSTKTDTVYSKVPYKIIEIQTKYITKPISVIVYKHDTLLRQEAEHQDIITNVQFVHHNLFNRKLDFLQVDKIDTAGNIFSSKYNASKLSIFHIDGKGNVQVVHKKYIALKIIGVAILSGTTAFFIKKEFFPNK